MTFFNTTEPIIRKKQEELDIQDLRGLWQIDWKIGKHTLLSAAYTRVDQAFLVWGVIVFIIFTSAQFLPLSWDTQAVFWSPLTLLGTLSMVALTYYWARIERAIWLVSWWAFLMVIGLVLTNLGIFGMWTEILLYLCPLWLGISALGYLSTGIGLRSRALFLAGVGHLAAIALLPHFLAWQFLFTGGVMATSLFLLAELQWDMRTPIEYAHLSREEVAFNRCQHRRRQRKEKQQFT